MRPPPPTLRIHDAQRRRPLPQAAIHRVARAVLEGQGLDADITVHFISPRRSAELNRRHLGHTGATDILTFDLGSTPTRLSGELFICVEEAVRQAPEFGTQWRQELLRYLIHGLLHLQGFDDREPADRRRMKRREDALVRRWVTGSTPGGRVRARP
ncbi:MAG: rRNA maturation RNase YbeY [Verrucomicrobiae bacterium]|nr:rRNA maturation RNase YbeY [Verrucomicrobiae bacterium]